MADAFVLVAPLSRWPEHGCSESPLTPENPFRCAQKALGSSVISKESSAT